MIHKFLEPGDWFLPKRYGYGAGLPIAWQGWVLITAYIGTLVGISFLSKSHVGAVRILAFLLFLLLTGLLILITHRRTRGGWRWRWGDKE